MSVTMNNSRLHKALLAIITEVGREYDRGYGGVCIELETLHTKIRNRGRRPIQPYTPEEMAIVAKRTVRMMEATHTVKYYGSPIEGCEIYHNANGAWVGHLLVIEEPS
jgi:hypothetical protein